MEQCFQGWQEVWVVSSDELTLCLGGIRVRGQLSAQGKGAAAETGEKPRYLELGGVRAWARTASLQARLERSSSVVQLKTKLKEKSRKRKVYPR